VCIEGFVEVSNGGGTVLHLNFILGVNGCAESDRRLDSADAQNIRRAEGSNGRC